MRDPSTPELLEVWERGRASSPLQRALTLLAAACPEVPREALLHLSIGQRDALLLQLRERLFGASLAGIVTCPACGDEVELKFEVPELLAHSTSAVESEMCLSVEGYEVRIRLPNSEDLAFAVEQQGEVDPRDLILQRCLLEIRGEDTSAADRRLPPAVQEAVCERLTQADPLADIQLAVRCPSCGYSWHSSFDIVSFLWTEIEAWAIRLLHDVHWLARAYGWREHDILGLSPFRRQFYFQMAGA